MSSSSSGCFHCSSSTCFRLHTIDPLDTLVRQPSLSQVRSLLAMIHSSSNSGRVNGPVYHPSRKTLVIEFGSESAAQSILPPAPGPFTVRVCSRSSSYTSFQVIEIQTPSISGRQSGLPTGSPGRVYDPSKSSRHRIWVRVSGPVYHPSPSETVVIEFMIRVRVGGAVYPLAGSRAIHGRHQTGDSNTSFQVIEIQTPSISGRQSLSGSNICHQSKSSRCRHLISPAYHPSAVAPVRSS